MASIPDLSTWVETEQLFQSPPILIFNCFKTASSWLLVSFIQISLTMEKDMVTQSNILHTPRASFQIALYSIKNKIKNCTIPEFKLSQVDYYSITALSSHPKHGIG